MTKSEEQPLLQNQESSAKKSRTQVAIEKKESLGLITDLKKTESLFFDVIKTANNPNDLRNFLTKHRNFDINVKNRSGLTALSIAIEQGKPLEQINALLSLGCDIREAHLVAISKGDRLKAELLLNAVKQKFGPDAEFQSVQDSPVYEEYVTPMMVAAKSNNIEMIQLLLERKHKQLDPLHIPYCHCQECQNRMASHQTYANYRRYMYSALASPAYLFASAEDPILQAFKLRRSLEMEASVDREYAEEYKKLSRRLKEMTGTLMSLCRTDEEVEAILSNPEGFHSFSGVIPFMPRLQLALDTREKPFVAAAPVQTFLMKKWVEHRHDWSWRSPTEKMLTWMLHLLIAPLVAVLNMFYPSFKLVKNYQTPHSVFVFHLESLIIFNMLLFACMILDMDRKTEGIPETGLEIPIMVWVFGFWRNLLKRLWTLGVIRFFRRFWSLYDFITYSLFMITFGFWFASVIRAVFLENKRETKTESDRSKWDALDPTLVHEGLFVVASFMTYFSLVYYLQVNATFGPWQVSLRKVALQIYIYVAVILVILCPYGILMSWLYHNYDGMKSQSKSGEDTKQPEGFVSLENAVFTLFWAVLAQSDPEAANVVTNGKGDEAKNHWFTKIIGYFLYVFFCVLMQVALINVLIAVITNTFQKVIDNADTEWKFARTQVHMTFFQEASRLPPPLNLLPSVSDLVTFGGWVRQAAGRQKGVKIKFTLKGLRYEFDEILTAESKRKFQESVKSLIERYLEQDKSSEGKSKD